METAGSPDNDPFQYTTQRERDRGSERARARAEAKEKESAGEVGTHK
jgi:hypothetical protein